MIIDVNDDCALKGPALCSCASSTATSAIGAITATRSTRTALIPGRVTTPVSLEIHHPST